ncbi:PAAR domain-containing protein [Pantoea sp. BIGb0393]|uniref:PAAR domain-containing protein n=1 Tax=Pantoea nemavictus TaxID=2726955 RepID=A0ABU8PZ23_9GAMM|nr:PAAR domain-containing protein [Pantoea nemavictus]MBA0039018.1 PAAR domain-containing protein [Pantoea nemavictus]
MKGIIRVGDKTTGGGQVKSGSEKMIFQAIGVARINDPVSCPILGHSPSYIAQGHPTMKDNGVAVAFDGYKCSCGCTLISSLTNATTSK